MPFQLKRGVFEGSAQKSRHRLPRPGPGGAAIQKCIFGCTFSFLGEARLPPRRGSGVIRVGDVARIVETHFPVDCALPGDSIGLQSGDARQRVRGILVALDPSPEAIRRARSLKTNLLVTHHPLLYEPLKSVDTTSLTGSAVQGALAGDIAVYSAHTNLDSAPQGLARELARRIGLAQVDPFPDSFTGRWLKLAVFVPEGDAGKVHRAMAAAGAGHVGKYDLCAFTAVGEGMFRPLKGARPALGSTGRLEKVREARLEMLVEKGSVPGVVAAMKKAHPYEEVAFDLYPLLLPDGAGIGCTGTVGGISPGRLARRLADRFKAEVRLSGRPPSVVTRVAVVPGSGGGYLEEARRKGAEILVTGEVRYHQMLEAEHLGMGVMELGHDRSEMPAVDLLAGAIRSGLRREKKTVRVYTYRRPRTARSLIRK